MTLIQIHLMIKIQLFLNKPCQLILIKCNYKIKVKERLKFINKKIKLQKKFKKTKKKKIL